MKKIKRALSLKGKAADETLSELAEQMSLDVNGKDNGELLVISSLTCKSCTSYRLIDVFRSASYGLVVQNIYNHFYSLKL